MPAAKNVLWIMADQLRWDYLSCYGHPHLHTPHIDALAAKGVRFDAAFVQSPFCGPSRMSYYTGRYCRSHGATWNGFPLRVGEPTLGDYLRPLGVRAALVGKTHMIPDSKGMEWLGIDPAFADRRPAVGMRFRAVRARRRPAPGRALRSRSRLRQLPAPARLPRPQPVGGMGELGRRRRRRNPLRLAHALRQPAGARERRAFRDALHDAAGDGLHGQSRRPAVAVPSLLHQAALALYRAGALSQHVRQGAHPAAGALGSTSATPIIRSTPPIRRRGCAARSRKTKCASA